MDRSDQGRYYNKNMDKRGLFLLVILASMSAISNEHPLIASQHPFQSRVVTLQAQGPSSSQRRNIFPMNEDISNQLELTLGASRMKSNPAVPAFQVAGWRLWLQRSDSHYFIVVELYQGAINWVLTLNVLTIRKKLGIKVFSGLHFTLEQIENKNDSIIRDMPYNSSRKSQKAIRKMMKGSRTKSTRLQCFILINGLIARNITGMTNSVLALRQVELNSTHISYLALRVKKQQVSQLFFSFLIFDQIQLLKNYFYLQISELEYGDFKTLKFSQPQNAKLLTENTQSSELLEEDDNWDWQILLEIKRIDCTDKYWSIRSKQCLSKCKSFQKVGSVYHCLDRVRLLQSCTSTSDNCGGPSTVQIVPCPMSISYCSVCQLNHGSGRTLCRTCNSGYYRTQSGLCQVCPIGCTTCSLFNYFGINRVDCHVCSSTFTKKGVIINTCECNSNQYMDISSTPTCINCPTSCSSCTDNTTCTGCVQGYYLASSWCYPCMTVCKTCNNAISCSSCKNNLVITGTICGCGGGRVLDSGTLTCITCSTFDPNCQTCSYNPPYSPNAPLSSIVCSAAIVGYFVEVNGTTSPCEIYCDYCSSASVCTNCSSTFNQFNGSCICSPLFLTNSAQPYCDNCSSIIPGCDICQTSVSTTECASCISNYYPSGGTHPTASCLPCLPSCSSCSSASICTGCYSPFFLSGNDCLCTGMTYVNAANDQCLACNAIIVNCDTCVSALPTTCSLCDVGFSPSLDGLQCYACSLNCASCDATGCLICNSGYTRNGAVCQCVGQCLTCLANSGGACADCVPTDCAGCAAGWHLSGTTCLGCLSECESCADGSSCISCPAPFVLNLAKRCVCNNTAGQYLTLDGLDCQLCSIVIGSCVSCLATPGTFCAECMPGLYYNTSTQTCLACTLPCTTCDGDSTNCTSCSITYTLNLTAQQCRCDDTVGLFYSAASLGCSPCSDVIQLCNTCQSDPLDYTIVTCSVCSDPYYPDVTGGSCLPCDARCTSCTSLSTCSSCATNLLGNGTHCLCDTGTDPNLAYNSQINLCISCLLMISNCLSCQPEPLNCTSCLNGTYLNGTQCLPCPSQCQTCDASGCLSCPTGTTISGNQCVCDTACLACQTTADDCLNCMINGMGVVTQCYSCASGTYLSNDNMNCLSCPSGCATCTTNGACQTCLNTFILNGAVCQCRNELGLYQNQDVCQPCGDIFYGCTTCSYDGSISSCNKCVDGMYLNGTICGYCDSSCLTCSSQTVCTSCPQGYSLSGSSCVCGVACTNCGSNQSQCTACIQNIYGSFGQCTACQPSYYLDSWFQCQICPSNCVTCDSNANCTSCLYSRQVIDGVCTCNSNANMILNTAIGQCQLCTLYHPNCESCQVNISDAKGYDCAICVRGYYLLNESCELQICGDGIVTLFEQCDDKNNLDFDGCHNCKIQQYYNCSGEPSICLVQVDQFIMAYDSVEVSTTKCNQLTIFFKLDPIYAEYNQANFSLMLAAQSSSHLILLPDQYIYYEGVVGYRFKYTSNVLGKNVKAVFTPGSLEIASIAHVPLYPVYFTLGESFNSVSLRHHQDDVCETKEVINTYLDTVEYTSLGVLAISSIPAKIVGLELFGVIQLTFLSLGSMDHLNPLHSSFVKLGFSNGYKFQLDKKEPTNARRLQTTASTSSRIQTIGYTSNFLRNCNLMFIIVSAVMLISFILYLFTNFCKQYNCFYTFTRRLFKQVLLSLILFNCFNFAYCSGLHLTYADAADELYTLGTIAAIAAILAPLFMVIVLQCTEDEGFGEYKDKLKEGKIERAYFMVTIFYRMAIGYYMSTMNQDMLSTLIVLLFSIYFLIYNLVNLPFKRAYHNYRANICHLSQFLILYLTMYYRTMNTDSTTEELNQMIFPVYFQLGALGFSIVISAIVLIVDICVWVSQIIDWCKKRNETLTGNETQSNDVIVQKGRERGQSFATMNDEFFIQDIENQQGQNQENSPDMLSQTRRASKAQHEQKQEKQKQETKQKQDELHKSQKEQNNEKKQTREKREKEKQERKERKERKQKMRKEKQEVC